MSYIALITDAFDAMVGFYAGSLGAPTVAEWDRPGGRGRSRRVDLHGLEVEILDNGRERHPAILGPGSGRTHLVVEVDDIVAAREALAIAAPEPVETSWGATIFELKDPDGTPVYFLQWSEPRI